MAAVGPSLVLRPLWFDELATHWIAEAPDFETFLARMSAGTEPSPPLFLASHYLAVRLLGDSPWALRLPELAGFALALLGLYRFVSWRLRPVWGGVAGCCFLLTGSIYYAQEARAYGLVLGMAGCAMAAWQRHAEGGGRRYALLTCAALGLAGCFHYYAVLLTIPFAVGEAARFWQRRRFDWLMIPVLGAPGLAVALHLPLIRAVLSHKEFSAQAWSQPVWNFPQQFWTTALTPTIPALLLVGWWVFWRPSSETLHSAAADFPLPDAALLTGYLLLPLAGLIFGKLVTNVATPRYVYSAVLGFSAIGAVLLARLTVKGGAILLMLAGVICTSAGLDYRWFIRHPSLESISPPNVSGSETLPLVIDDYLRFAQLTYYADPSVRQRLYYLTDAEMLPRFTRAGQMETITGLAVRSGSLAGQTADVKVFLRDHPRFLLFEPMRPEPQESWLSQALLTRGVPLLLTAVQSGGRWYLATPPAAAPATSPQK